MMHLNLKTAGVAAAMLLLGVTGAVAGQAYDPMRAVQGMPAATPEGGPAAALNPEFGNLPDTAGVEDTYYMCSACHSTAIIKQQKISDARWDYLWDWMIEDQGMADPGEETKETILGYLKEHFSSER
ncbi:hypothetical protein [Mesorhizobium sp. A623]